MYKFRRFGSTQLQVAVKKILISLRKIQLLAAAVDLREGLRDADP